VSTTKRPGKRSTRTRPRAAAPSSRTLERRVKELGTALEEARERHARQAAALRRGADRRIAAMMQELAHLRHHEARAEALTRMVAERDVTVAAQAERIARLESLLQTPASMGEI
jgi:hypothetical protein